jgi:hypothetical protein
MGKATINNYIDTNMPAPPPSPTKNYKPRTKNQEMKTILQIEQHRLDRIIFLGKEV